LNPQDRGLDNGLFRSPKFDSRDESRNESFVTENRPNVILLNVDTVNASRLELPAPILPDRNFAPATELQSRLQIQLREFANQNSVIEIRLESASTIRSAAAPVIRRQLSSPKGSQATEESAREFDGSTSSSSVMQQVLVSKTETQAVWNSFWKSIAIDPTVVDWKFDWCEQNSPSVLPIPLVVPLESANATEPSVLEQWLNDAETHRHHLDKLDAALADLMHEQAHDPKSVSSLNRMPQSEIAGSTKSQNWLRETSGQLLESCTHQYTVNISESELTDKLVQLHQAGWSVAISVYQAFDTSSNSTVPSLLLAHSPARITISEWYTAACDGSIAENDRILTEPILERLLTCTLLVMIAPRLLNVSRRSQWMVLDGRCFASIAKSEPHRRESRHWNY
jgi:hypothetical protein